MKRFAYLRDGLFLWALGIYGLNKLLILPHFGGFLRSHGPMLWSFLHGHLDDLLLMPAAIPVVLWGQHQLRLRADDQPPSRAEMAGHWLIWSVMCKVVGPFYFHIGVADPWDVLCFAVGGMAAYGWWHHPRWGNDEVGP